METTIVKIEGNKIEVIEDNDVKGYELAEWVKPDFVKLGSAEITIKDGKVAFCSMKQLEKSDKPKEKTGKEESHIVNIKGKDFMTYEGLLEKVHEKGKFSIEILDSWQSEDLKRAWCKIRLIVGEHIIDGIGSSTPENTGQMTQDHPIEMANTRAKGRAFRDYLNIGKAMAEELKK